MCDEASEMQIEKDRTEAQKNRAEEKKLLREADEISSRLKYGWLRIGLAGAAFGVTLSLFLFNNFLPLLAQDLESAPNERGISSGSKKRWLASASRGQKRPAS